MGRVCVWVSLLALCLVGMSFASVDTQSADSPQDPVISEPVLTDTGEVTTARSANTRTWENVYQVPVLDADGNPTGETEEVRRSYIEVGDGLNYDARPWAEIAEGGAGNWQRTAPDWVRTASDALPLAVTAGPLHVTLSDDLTRWDHVRVQGDAETLILGVAGLVIQNTATGDFLILEQPQRVRAVVEGNRVLYPGALSCGDIEYVYERGGFKQNLIIRDLSGIPTPESLGFDPATTVVGLASTMDLGGYAHALNRVAPDAAPVAVSDALALSDAVQVADAESLAFVNASGREVLRFGRGDAWDGTGPDVNFTAVREAMCRRGAQDLLIDAVDFSWLAEAELPVTVDYLIELPGTADPDRVLFERGITYFITGSFTLDGSDEELVIEPGAIIKFNGDGSPNSLLRLNNGATIRALGNEFDPIIFTHARQTGVGEDVTSHQSYDADDSTYNLMVYPDASTNGANDSVFIHCRFSDLYIGIQMGEVILADDFVRHSVFRDCVAPVRLSGTNDVHNRFGMLNCLMAQETQAGTGVFISFNDNADEVTFTARNLTIHNFVSGVYLRRSAGSGHTAHLSIQNSLFTNCTRGVYNVHSSWISADGEVNYNAYDQVTNGFLVYVPGVTSTPNTDLNGTPYLAGDDQDSYPTSPAGDYYTAEWSGSAAVGPQVSDLVNQGAQTASSLNLGAATIAAPIRAPASIAPNSTWQPQASVDVGTVDIGFHYPQVDYVVSDAGAGFTGDFTIEAGTRVAMEPSFPHSTSIGGETGDYGDVRYNGEPGNEILFFSTRASGDEANVPGASDYYHALGLTDLPFESAVEVRNCVIRHAVSGISFNDGSARPVVENCQFIDCRSGVNIWQIDADVLNCLFIRAGGIGLSLTPRYTGTVFWNVIGNTFFGCETGVQETYSGTEARTVNIVHENNLYLANEMMINGPPQTGLTHVAVDRNNAHWQNSGFNSGLVDLDPAEHNLESNPLVAHRATAGQLRWSLDEGDGLYLAQGSGDASRWPFAVPDGETLAASAGISVTGITLTGTQQIRVGVRPPSTLPDRNVFMGQLLGTSYTRPNPVINGDGIDRLWLEVFNTEDYDWPTGAFTVTLTFTNSETLNISVPDRSTILEAGSLWSAWVAHDGSTYHGRSNHGEGVFDQDSGYALAVDPGGLAQGAFDARLDLLGTQGQAQSPLVDMGSQDLLSSGSTSTLRVQDNEDDSLAPLMDIGYHYPTSAGAQEMHNPVQTISGVEVFVHNPSDPGNPVLVNADLIEIESHAHIDLASGAFDEGTQEDTTLAVFRTAPYDFGDPLHLNAVALGIARFRSSTDLVQVGNGEVAFLEGYFLRTDPIPQRPVQIHNVDIYATPDRHDGSHTGEIYAAVVVEWDLITAPGGSSLGLTTHDEIVVLRYEPSLDKFVSIAFMAGADYPNTRFQVSDVAICADNTGNQDLWVFYVERVIGDGGPAQLFGARILNAATHAGDPVRFNRFMPPAVVPMDRDVRFTRQFQPGKDILSLEADFDFSIPHLLGGMPRVSYLDWEEGVPSDPVGAFVGTATLSPGSSLLRGDEAFDTEYIPRLVGGFTGIQDSLSLTNNHRFEPGSGNARAFVGNDLDGSLYVHRFPDGGSQWVSDGPEPSFGAGDQGNIDVTYRFSGTSRRINSVGSTLETSDGLLPDVLTGSRFPLICTNGDNLADVFAVWSSGALDPENDPDDTLQITHMRP